MSKLNLIGIISAAWLMGYSSSNIDPHSANFISKDSANRMIQSYLSSIDAVDAQEQLNSLILDADDIRTYLSDTAIRGVKIMFAHTLEYINSGNEGLPAGLESGALTVILAGYNSRGNYVFAPGMRVLNKARPCPTKCLTTGSASNHILE
ncbi:MAG: hypothetical protein BGO09_16275 [Bacteroidetes bacterium 47-18]|nr:MAG: hypothetical protein BGO09_16275 [Bacteroidetes bacterium 47-18]